MSTMAQSTGSFRLRTQTGASGALETWLADFECVSGSIERVVLHAVATAPLDAHSIARLEQAWRALARVDHPNLARIVEIGEIEGRTFVASEQTAGRSLAAVGARLEALGVGFPLHTLLRVLADAASGLAALHASPAASGLTRPLGHGRLTEADIVLGFGGQVKVYTGGITVLDRVEIDRPAADLRSLQDILSRYLTNVVPGSGVQLPLELLELLSPIGSANGVRNVSWFCQELRRYLLRMPMPPRPLGAFAASLFESDPDVPHSTRAFLSVEAFSGAREARERRIQRTRVGRTDFESFRAISAAPPADSAERLSLRAEAEARFERGMSLVKARDWAAAMEEWERAIELDPNNRLYQFNLRRLREITGFQENR